MLNGAENLKSTVHVHFPVPQKTTVHRGFSWNWGEKCKDEKAVKRVGVEWAIAQSKELKAAGVPCLHYYTMSRSEATIEIAKAVF